MNTSTFVIGLVIVAVGIFLALFYLLYGLLVLIGLLVMTIGVLQVGSSPTRTRTVGGWSLVVFGIAVAVFGFLSMGVYSPSFTEEDQLRIIVVGSTICAVGILMVVLGWRMLRVNKKEKTGA
jgi:hypothetical protein